MGIREPKTIYVTTPRYKDDYFRNLFMNKKQRIQHKLDKIYAQADRVRDQIKGSDILSEPIRDLEPIQLLVKMICEFQGEM